jgi:hypothetical protein
MQKIESLGRPSWKIKLKDKGFVNVTKRDDHGDYLISSGDISIQCPTAWLSIHRNLDNYNGPQSEDNETLVSLNVASSSSESTLASIVVEPTEYEELNRDSILGALCTSFDLSKEDTM